MNWKGVMPAITTCFNNDLSVDHAFMAKHCRWLLDNGCTGIVTLGSLGEGATWRSKRRLQILRTCVQRGPRARSGRGGDLGAIDCRGGGAGEGRRELRMRRPDGSASLCI